MPGKPIEVEAADVAATDRVPEQQTVGIGPPPVKPRAAEIEEGTRPLEEIVNPIDPKATPQEKAAQLAKLSDENEPILQDLARQIDEATGGTSKVNRKAPERIVEKGARPSILVDKPWHGVEHVRDSLRFKTAINSFEDVETALGVLERNGAQLVKVDTDKMFKPKEWGWRFAAFDLRMPNGQLVEYYLPLKELEEVKDANHLLFEKWRNTTADERLAKEAEYRADLAASRETYSKAFGAALRRLGLDETAARASWTSFSERARSGSIIAQERSGPTMPRSQPAPLRTSGSSSETIQTSPDPSSRPGVSSINTNGSATAPSTPNMPPPAAVIQPPPLPGSFRVGNRVANVNLARIATGEDVRDVITLVAEEAKKAGVIADTATQSTDEARKLADLVAADPEKVRTVLSGKSAAGRAFTREEIIATGMMVEQNGRGITRLARKIVSEGGSDAEKLGLQRMVAPQNDLIRRPGAPSVHDRPGHGPAGASEAVPSGRQPLDREVAPVAPSRCSGICRPVVPALRCAKGRGPSSSFPRRRSMPSRECPHGTIGSDGRGGGSAPEARVRSSGWASRIKGLPGSLRFVSRVLSWRIKGFSGSLGDFVLRLRMGCKAEARLGGGAGSGWAASPRHPIAGP